MTSWMEPPRLRGGEGDEARRATWLELFYDLVFVVAVSQVAHNLSKARTKHRLAAAGVLFIVAIAGASLPPVIIIATTAAVCAIEVGLDLYNASKRLGKYERRTSHVEALDPSPRAGVETLRFRFPFFYFGRRGLIYVPGLLPQLASNLSSTVLSHAKWMIDPFHLISFKIQDCFSAGWADFSCTSG